MPEKENGKLTIKINGKDLTLTPFVQKIIRKAVLAMLSTLKNTKIQGDETIEINVKEAA